MFFFIHLIINGITLFIIQKNCDLAKGALVCMIIGVILEYLVTDVGDGRGGGFFKELLYFGAILLQIVPLLVESFGFLNAEKVAWIPDSGEINFIMSVAVGIISVTQFVLFFLNGYEGGAAPYFRCAILPIALLVEVILASLIGNERTVLIVNIVISFVSMAGIAVARLIMGSNME